MEHDVTIDRVFLRLGPNGVLGADEHQWILYRAGNAVSFVRSTKLILARCIREKGIELSPRAVPPSTPWPTIFQRGGPTPPGGALRYPPRPRPRSRWSYGLLGRFWRQGSPCAGQRCRGRCRRCALRGPTRSWSRPAKAPSCCCLWSAPTPPHFDPARQRRCGADRPTGPTKPTSDSLCTATPIATRPVRTSSFEKFGLSRWARSGPSSSWPRFNEIHRKP